MLFIFGFCLAVLFFYFLIERILLDQKLRRIPRRVCVTGTRGKSAVTRLIAAACREAGFKVVAKTTGSKPVMIFPDGAEKEISRRGRPSILEQKKILRIARRVKADTIVAEMMSIRPECLKAETGRLLRPHVTAVTNVRLDHMDDMGRTKPEIAESLASAIPAHGTLFVLEKEYYPVFQAIADQKGTRLIKVSQDFEGSRLRCGDRPAVREFPENRQIALAVSQFLGIHKTTALAGMAKVRPDFGGLKIWKFAVQSGPSTWYSVSAFAANEPESTREALDMIRREFTFLPKKMIGLLALRQDRGDRTRQWLQALSVGYFSEFERLFFIGDHARAIGRKRKWAASGRPKVTAICEKEPAKIIEDVLAHEAGDGLLIGMGNIGGLGGRIVEHWASMGTSL